MMDAARSLGLPARFVSGYVFCGSAPHSQGGGHTHAWTRVRVPGEGWVDFDPTNGATGGAGLIRVAVVRDPKQALPLHGCWYGPAEDFIAMDVEVDVAAELPERGCVKLALTG
jgi:transglutaminase-like putative cysteine protease